MIDLSIIETDRGAVPSAGDDWQLHDDGLEHRETGYFIDRDALGARRHDGLWEWPLHLSEKSWCAPRAFRVAFLAALDRFGIECDAALSRSFAIGFGMRTGSAAIPQAGFVALGEFVRPKPVERKRPEPIEPRAVVRGRRPERVRMAAGVRA